MERVQAGGIANTFKKGFLLLGVPGETRDTVEESLEYADSPGLIAVVVNA